MGDMADLYSPGGYYDRYDELKLFIEDTKNKSDEEIVNKVKETPTINSSYFTLVNGIIENYTKYKRLTNKQRYSLLCYLLDEVEDIEYTLF